MGSPETHRWMWSFYTPKLQILEFFSYTDEGWKEANLVEKRLIEPDLNNPLCLNENCGGVVSLEARRRSRILFNFKLHQVTDSQGRSCHAVKMNEKAHAEKDESGKSLKGKKDGQRINSQMWEDPDHPEIGRHNPGNLVKVQRAHGYPYGPENRRKVTEPFPVL